MQHMVNYDLLRVRLSCNKAFCAKGFFLVFSLKGAFVTRLESQEDMGISKLVDN